MAVNMMSLLQRFMFKILELIQLFKIFILMAYLGPGDLLRPHMRSVSMEKTRGKQEKL